MTARILLTTVTVIALSAFPTMTRDVHAERTTPAPAQAMVDAAQQTFSLSRARFEGFQGSLDETYQWSVRWLEAMRRHRPASARTASQAHLARMRDVCVVARRMVGQGALHPAASHACDYYVAEAQLWVNRGR